MSLLLFKAMRSLLVKQRQQWWMGHPRVLKPQMRLNRLRLRRRQFRQTRQWMKNLRLRIVNLRLPGIRRNRPRPMAPLHLRLQVTGTRQKQKSKKKRLSKSGDRAGIAAAVSVERAVDAVETGAVAVVRVQDRRRRHQEKKAQRLVSPMVPAMPRVVSGTKMKHAVRAALAGADRRVTGRDAEIKARVHVRRARAASPAEVAVTGARNFTRLDHAKLAK